MLPLLMKTGRRCLCQAVLVRARDAGVVGIVVPGIQASDWQGLLALCRAEAGIYPALGLHPVFLEQHQPADLSLLETELAQQQPVAVGEIGLDFQIDGLDHERQQQLFESQLVIARDAGLPVILHVRKAHDQVLATLKRIRVRGGICHAFNGSLQQASQYRDLGFRFGFGGMLTFERSSRLRKLAVEWKPMHRTWWCRSIAVNGIARSIYRIAWRRWQRCEMKTLKKWRG
jgi:TatD DNase family protein